MREESGADDGSAAAAQPVVGERRRGYAADSVVATTPIDERGEERPGLRAGREGAYHDEAGDEARTFMDALRALETDGDVDSIVALYADDADVSNPTDAAPHRGARGARAFWSAYGAAFARVESRFRDVVQSGDTAFLEWRSEGETAAGVRFAYDGVSVLEFDGGGKIRRFRAYFDPAKLTSRPGA